MSISRFFFLSALAFSLSRLDLLSRFNFVSLTSQIVLEKERHLREAMKQMGLYVRSLLFIALSLTLRLHALCISPFLFLMLALRAHRIPPTG